MATVLIAEDEATLRLACKVTLERAGYTVLEAADGAAGLETALDKQPDMILLDIHMPNMSGFEMLKKLRNRNDWGAKVPVVFFTNIAPSSDDEMADIEGLSPADYLIKSDTTLDEIVEKVRSHIG